MENKNQQEKQLFLSILQELEQIPKEYLKVVFGVVQAFRQNLPIENGNQENKTQNDKESKTIKLIKHIKFEEKDNYTFEDIKEIAAQFPVDYKWTYQDILIYFPQDLSIKVEIINNQLFIMPTPNTTHQIISDELVFQFNVFVRKNNLGRVLAAPMDVKFDENNTVQPDILFIAVTRYEIIKEKNIEGNPTMVVEIWSPSNKKKERESKKENYRKNGVTEFWQIYPKKKEVSVEVLNEKGEYEIYSEAKQEGCIKSKVLIGFEMELSAIFLE
jgi:Uma2 family endonuclease